MITQNDYTVFEKTRIISARTLQIAMGAPILIKKKTGKPLEIAIQEFDKDVLPITVKREMPKKL